MTISGHMLRMAAAATRSDIPTVPGTPYGGGFYFGDITIGSDVWALIIADKSSETQGLLWKTSNTDSPGTSSFLDGWANTNAMNNAEHPAAMYCLSYSAEGFDDWFMWSRDEAEVAFNNIAPENPLTPAAFRTGGAQALEMSTSTRDYWTSTQYSAAQAFSWRVGAGSALMLNVNKTTATRTTRPIRRVKRN